MKVYSAALILPDGRSFSIRYLLDADELAGLPWRPLHDADSTVSMELRTQPNSVFALAEVMA